MIYCIVISCAVWIEGTGGKERSKVVCSMKTDYYAVYYIRYLLPVWVGRGSFGRVWGRVKDSSKELMGVQMGGKEVIQVNGGHVKAEGKYRRLVKYWKIQHIIGHKVIVSVASLWKIEWREREVCRRRNLLFREPQFQKEWLDVSLRMKNKCRYQGDINCCCTAESFAL